MVYIAQKNQKFPEIDQPTLVLSGDDNIIALKDINISIESGKSYKWRVDCVESPPTYQRRRGDVWKFTMKD